MKVLHVIPSVAPVRGGPSHTIIEIVKNLCLIEKVEAEIVTTNDNGDQLLDVPLDKWCEYQGVPVRFFPRFSPAISAIREFSFSASLTTWLWHNIKNYDLIHVHAIFSYCSTVTMAICRQQKVPYINRPLGQLCRWSLEYKKYKKAVYLQTIEKANLQGAKVLHLTTVQEQKELEQLHWDLSSAIIPHGLTPPKLIDNARSKLCQLLGIRESTFILLFLSRLHPKKGLDHLIPALTHLQEDFVFVLAGSGTPEYEAEIDRLLAKYQLTNRTHKLGFVSGDKKDLCLQGADLFLLPSYSENFGIAVLEALGAGTPALVTPGVALAPDIELHQVGYVVPQEPKAIGDAITKHFSLSPGEREQLSQKARQFAIENYAWDKIVQQLFTVYQWMMGLRPKPDCVTIV